LICFLFGIEKTFFDQLQSKEKNEYNKLAFVFLFIILISIISGSYLAYMIFKSVIINILIGIFIGFTIFNLLRFSLSSIEKSYDKESVSINRSSYFFKIFIFSILAIFIAFPFASLIQRNNSQKIILNHKLKIIKNHEKFLDITRYNNLKLIDQKILSTEKKFKKNENFLFNQTRLEDLNNERKSTDSLYNQLNIKKLARFKESVMNAELPLFQMKNISTNPTGISIFIIILLLLYFLLNKMKSLVYNLEFDYCKKSYKFHKTRIIDDSLKTNNLISKILDDKYNFSNFSND
jgi:hypothetical protein